MAVAREVQQSTGEILEEHGRVLVYILQAGGAGHCPGWLFYIILPKAITLCQGQRLRVLLENSDLLAYGVQPPVASAIAMASSCFGLHDRKGVSKPTCGGMIIYLRNWSYQRSQSSRHILRGPTHQSGAPFDITTPRLWIHRKAPPWKQLGTSLALPPRRHGLHPVFVLSPGIRFG